MTVPEGMVVDPEDWSQLDPASQQFLIEAKNGGMRYLIEAGKVCAWGPAIEGIFSMPVSVQDQKYSTGEYVVFLPENH